VSRKTGEQRGLFFELETVAPSESQVLRPRGSLSRSGGTTKSTIGLTKKRPRYLYVICGQLISVIRSAALVGERDRGLLAAATELEHPLARDVAEQAVGPLVRDVGPVAHDVVRQGRLGRGTWRRRGGDRDRPAWATGASAARRWRAPSC
jgi:hypothetical protein